MEITENGSASDSRLEKTYRGESEMFEFLKTEGFNMGGSFIIALGIMAILKPGCRGSSCRILRAPPIEEVKSSTYQVGDRCYQFKTETVTCPKDGFIEAFERDIRS
jgi:hypothetical protein